MKIDTKDILNLIEVNCCGSCMNDCNATCSGCKVSKIVMALADLDTNLKKNRTQKINKIEIDAKSLSCPCYNCFDFDEKLQRCKNIQKDCISYCNWYSTTFKN